jgi:hypothetical protein
MIEAGAPSTGSLATHVYVVLCPPHRGYTWSHHSRSRATRRGRKAKAAPKRRPSAAKRIIRAEVPKDTGPIYLQASFVSAAAAGHALVLDDLAIKVVLGLDNAAKEHPAVYAGVGAIMISSGWVRWARGRLLCGHEAFPFVVRASGCW